MLRKLTDNGSYGSAGPDGSQAEYPHTTCEACKMVKGYPRNDRSIVTGPFTWLQGHPYCEVCYPRMVAVLEADAKLAGIQGKSLHEELIKDLGTHEQWAASQVTRHVGTEEDQAEARRQAEQYLRTQAEAIHEGAPRAKLPPELIGHPDGASYASVKAMEEGLAQKSPYIVCKVPDGFPFEGKEAAEKSLADGLEAMRKCGEDMAREREEKLLARVYADGTWADEPTMVKAKPEGA